MTAEYFVLGSSPSDLDDVNWSATPDATETVTQINWASTTDPFWTGGATANFGAEFTGYITVATAGTWTFYTNSDDGSKLWVNGTEVVDNDGLHGMTERSGTIDLTAGRHSFQVRFFERSGGQGVIASWEGPGVSKEVIPSSALTR